MASVFKKNGKFAVIYNGQLDGRPKGSRAYIYAIKSRKLADQIKVQKDLEEQLFKAKVHKPSPNASKAEAAELREIEHHIHNKDEKSKQICFYKSIIARGKHPRHAIQTCSHVRRLMKLASITRLSQIDAAPIQAAANSLIEKYGLSPRTANAAIKAVRQFSTWLASEHRTTHDLLHRRLTVYNEAIDTRRRRRELSPEEIDCLIDAAHNGPRRCKISGPDRAMLYQVAIGTGFRQMACLSLTKKSFHVGPKVQRPFIRLDAKFNKNRKDRDQEIRRDLADLLHAWLAVKPDEGPIWHVNKESTRELMMKRDLEAARAKWIAAAPNEKEREEREHSGFLMYQDQSGRFADFHSLRHTGISRVIRTAGLKVAQVWADHSTPVLTAKYGHLDYTDEQKALSALPGPVKPAQAMETAGTAQNPEKAGKVRKESESRKIG